MSDHDAGAGAGGAPPGVIASLRRFARTGIDVLHDRLRLLGNELEEERLRLAQMLVLGALAAFCLAMSALLVTALVVIAFWEPYRLVALGLLAALYLVGAVVTFLVLKAKAAQRTKLFSASLGELARDRDLLKS